MLALTLTQPWATLVAIGAKRIETRSWSTNYRGRLAIHAAKGMPGWADELTLRRPFYDLLREAGFDGLNNRLPRGAIVAVVDLVECRGTSPSLLEARWLTDLSDQERAFGDFSPGRFAWMLQDVKPLSEPIPARGSLGLWKWESPLGGAE